MAAAVEPLRAANLLLGRDFYDMVFLTTEPGTGRASVGAAFDTVPLAAADDRFDLVFVVAGGNPLACDPKPVARHLRRLERSGAALGGISGGAAILARAGLMTNRRFTVHWEHYDAVRELSPDLLLEKRLFVLDRDRFTCAGGTAPLDMMHALIVAEHGVVLGRRVADWFIHTRVRDAAEPQQSGLTERYNLHDPAVIAAIELMQGHLADPLGLDQIAGLVGISARQLQRLFSRHMGLSAMGFYRALRLELADRLLKQTSLPVGEVALATGFGNQAHFSRAFRDTYGVPPSERRAG